MPSTRMIPPRPSQARRKALSFLPCSLDSPCSSTPRNSGFWTGDRRIMDALSLLPFSFFLLTAVLTVEEADPKPCPGEVGWALVEGFWGSEESWHLILSLGLVGVMRIGVWRRACGFWISTAIFLFFSFVLPSSWLVAFVMYLLNF